MKHIKKYLILLLSLILICSNIVTSFADVTDINGGGYGGNTAPSTEAWINRYHALQENNGIRMYIVNKNGVVVSSFVDLVNYYPEHIDKFDSNLAKLYNKYRNWTGATPNKEKKFRYWSGFKYDSVYYGSYDSLQYCFSNTKGNKGDASNRMGAVQQKMYTYDIFETYFEYIYNLEFPEAVSPISVNGGMIESTDFRTGEKIQIPRDIQGPVQRLKDGSGQEGTGDTFVNQLYTKCKDGELVLTRILDMQMPVLDIHGNKVGEDEPLFNFIYEDDLQRLAELNAIDGKNHIVDVVKQQGYKVCAEPIHWAVNEVVLPTAPDGLNGVDLNAFYWTPCVEYGTVSQISYLTYNWLWDATKLWMQKYGWYTTDDAVTKYIAQAGQSWDWSLAYTAYMLDRTDVDLGMYSFYDIGIDPDTAEQQRLRFWHDYAGSLGYGIIVTDINASAKTPTWDSKTYPKDNYSPGPSPQNTNPDGSYPNEYPSESKDYDEKGTNHKFNIVKYYAKDNGAERKYLYNFSREEAIHSIDIMDEPGWKVTDYFTSSTYRRPPSQSDSYDNLKKTIPIGQFSGTEEGSIKVPANSNDKCLYVLLTQGLEVIKIYENDGVVDKIIVDDNPTITNNTYTVNTPDSGYNYTEAVISEKESIDPTRWDDVPKDEVKTENQVIKIDDNTKVIYIRYTKDSSNNAALVLHENEISHNFNLRDITGNLLKTIRHYKYISVPECGYFYDCGCSDDDDSCDCWSCNDDMDQESPGTYYFEVVNKPSYDTQFVYKWKESNTVYNGEGGGYQGFEVEASPYMEFTLSRAYGDKPTLYPGLNSNNVKTVLNEMGIASESYKPAKTRYGNKSEQSKRVSWTNTFTTNWVYPKVIDPTIQWEHDDHDWDSDLQTSNDGSYEEIKNTSSRYDIGQIKTYSSYYKVWNGTSWKKFRKSTYGSKSKARAAAEEYSNELKAQSNASATGGIGNLNNGYSQPNNTKILGLWGKVNNGLTKPGTDNYKFDLGGMNFYTRKSVLNTNNKITFYPYYQMVIEHLNMSSTPVYFTSENLSTLLNVDRVDTSVFKSGNGNGLKLQSYQWSMHARIQNNMAEFGIMDRDSFLPTGAIYTLATGKEAGVPDVWVGFRVLSTYVADKSKLASNTGINNESEVNTKISNFKTQVEKSLTNYEIVMHGAEGLSVDETNFYGDSAQLTGKVGAYKLAGQKMDTDPKYDLKSGGDGANRSDIDILDTIEETHDFKLESDVNGNITVSMDGNKLEVIPKGKTSFSNDVVKDLDDRTKVVTNYINALDRNMGSDRNNKSWYNEAWSELHVKDVKFAYKLGFGDGEALRSAALNIKLNGRLENRDDMYNLDKDTIKEKARTFRFYTSAKSTLNEAASKPAGWVGDYAGQQVVVPGIHELFTSKLFYTSNTTVQDLN